MSDKSNTHVRQTVTQQQLMYDSAANPTQACSESSLWRTPEAYTTVSKYSSIGGLLYRVERSTNFDTTVNVQYSDINVTNKLLVIYNMWERER